MTGMATMENNGNGHGQVLENVELSLRERVFALLSESGTSPEQDLKVLSQCASHIRNRMLVEKIAKSCKLKLSGFLFNNALELYYDLKSGREEMGYISKGWEDPGFRIGDLIEIPKPEAARFKAGIRQLRKFCAVNGIGITVARKKGCIEIQMDGVIYSEGFNKKTFKSTLETLNECVQKANELIG
jgi:hypothetical protein